MKKITVIVPCFNEQEVLGFFYKEMRRVMDKMTDYAFELLLVNDGSGDGTLREMKELAGRDMRVRYLSFSRNFGKEAAIYAGLRNAAGDYVAIMDADLQDPPALLPEMVRALDEEGYDSVATRRVSRKGEPYIRSFFARCFYRLMHRISRVDMVDGSRDYRLMNRRFVDALLELCECSRFSKGLFGWVGFRTKWLEYENVERAAGETKWSFWRLFAYSIEGIIGFSTAPLVLADCFGCAAFVLGAAAFISLFFVSDAWLAPMVLLGTLLFGGGVLLLCVGILGQYLARVYLEVKNRPAYVVGETNIAAIRGAKD